LTLTSGVRIVVSIPKDPNGAVFNPSSSILPVNTRQYTVLYDRLLPDDPSMLAGTFDVTGPINVEMNENATAVLKNNISISVYSLNQGTNLRTNTAYAMWFTDC